MPEREYKERTLWPHLYFNILTYNEKIGEGLYFCRYNLWQCGIQRKFLGFDLCKRYNYVSAWRDKEYKSLFSLCKLSKLSQAFCNGHYEFPALYAYKALTYYISA